MSMTPTEMAKARKLITRQKHPLHPCVFFKELETDEMLREVVDKIKCRLKVCGM